MQLQIINIGSVRLGVLYLIYEPYSETHTRIFTNTVMKQKNDGLNAEHIKP